MFAPTSRVDPIAKETERTTMFIRSLLLAAVAATSIGAQASLVTSTSSVWPPVPSSGLQGVLFNEQKNGEVVVGLGAHAYFNGLIDTPDNSPNPAPNTYNSSANTFTASPGLYAGGAPGSNATYANWSFDFYYDISDCADCTVTLTVSVDSGNPFSGNLTGPNGLGLKASNSWNLEMPFLNIPFNPNSDSQTDFTLTARDASGTQLVQSKISVVVNAASNNVPEPGTLALMGLALAGMGALRRKS